MHLSTPSILFSVHIPLICCFIANALPGDLSFFSTHVGFVCNNILSYEITLANGTCVTASKLINPGLWRALKGGSNNFGIVTSFVARSFPSANIWSGFLYMTACKANQIIDAIHDFTKAEFPTHDENAAGPIFASPTCRNSGSRSSQRSSCTPNPKHGQSVPAASSPLENCGAQPKPIPSPAQRMRWNRPIHLGSCKCPSLLHSYLCAYQSSCNPILGHCTGNTSPQQP